MPLFSPGPVLLGHRGNGRGPQENTAAAFRRGLDAGLTWLESDVRATGDGTLVVAHGPADETGRLYDDLTGEGCRSDGVLLLDDLLELVPPGIGLDLDVKSSVEDALRPRTATTAALLGPVAARLAAERPVLVTSFDPAALLVVRETAPGVPLGLLTWITFPLRKAVPAAVHLGCAVVAAHTSSFFPRNTAQRSPAEVVGVAHEAGLEVMAWCPGADDAPALAALGVDALCVDDVPGVAAALDPA